MSKGKRLKELKDKKVLDFKAKVNPKSTRVKDQAKDYIARVYKDTEMVDGQEDEVTKAFRAGAFWLLVAISGIKKNDANVFFAELNREHYEWYQDIKGEIAPAKEPEVIPDPPKGSKPS